MVLVVALGWWTAIIAITRVYGHGLVQAIFGTICTVFTLLIMLYLAAH